jgi:hypothetical protein
MRIGLIAPPGVPVPPPAYGGTESVIDRLARGLVRAGHEVLLAAAANSACPVPRVGGTGEAADAAPVCTDTVTELRHVITSYAAMTDVDVVHDHTLIGPLYRHPPAGAPVVTTAHGPMSVVLWSSLQPPDRCAPVGGSPPPGLRPLHAAGRARHDAIGRPADGGHPAAGLGWARWPTSPSGARPWS